MANVVNFFIRSEYHLVVIISREKKTKSRKSGMKIVPEN